MANEKRRLIDANPLMKNGWHLVQTGESNRFLRSMSLADVPTVDAVEVVHGRWIEVCDAVMKCSECGTWMSWGRLSKFCPVCGALMTEGSEGDA